MVLMTTKDMDSIQLGYPKYFQQTGRLSGLRINLPAAPSRSPSGILRLSSPYTAMAGSRWILTIFPFIIT